PLGPMVQDGGARVPEAEAVKIFNAGRINLNLHSSPYCRGINPGGDYLNPRVFDLAACGAFQLVDRRSQLEEFFIPEVELAAFGSLQEARNQADYYLAHEEERREVGRRSRERCLREHTYTVRLAEALALVEEMHPGVLPRRPRPEPPLSELRRRFPPDHPVQEMLARFDAEEVRDLGDLVARLKEGEQPLGEAEAVFWLLHEFHQGLERGRF
ncbi:MAG: glycosyltransferase family 1 protein, partial [Deltaproteobacteria bacterium]|nr:glycosyltransferase family 1 protein [Deltaproteobacteria bacterium]